MARNRDKDHPKPVWINCLTCGGSGELPTGDKRNPTVTCHTCGGMGQVKVQ